jgi:hypothetical protein
VEYWTNDGNATYWMVLPIWKLEGPWQCEMCTCCQPQGLQGWSTTCDGLLFNAIFYIINSDCLHNFKDGQQLAPEELWERKVQGC